MGDYLPQYTNYFHLNEAYDEREYHVVQRPGGGGHGLIVAGTYPGKENPCQITTDRAIEFLLRREPGDRPFMLLVGYNWPHTPTLAPPPFDRLYDPDSLPIRHYDALAYAGRARFDRMCADRHGMATLTRAQIRQVWKDYMGCCAYVDSEIGRVLGAVESQGLAADTIVLCSADHGKLLGEWGAGEKGTFDREVWRVPFIWSWPGRVPQNRIVDEPCELIDTARTLMTLAGVADRIPAAYRGRDLFAANGQPPGAAFGVIRPGRDEDPAFDPHFMRVAIRTARYRMDMNWRMDGSPAPAEKRDGNLFDLANDPFETRNLWSDASSAPVVEQLGGRISAWLSSTETDARLLDPANAGRIF
jgi:arylsulfatase A-like enzyme